jgi:CobQ-like glutamine amidotransferase family enzyme/UDP-N-acetylmuramyl tripeptide synthase
VTDLDQPAGARTGPGPREASGRLARPHRLAAGAGRALARSSRLLGRGEGSVVGGRLTLAIDPGALRALARGRRLVLVTGTNGKTTTTRLLAAALGTRGQVVTNTGGANLPGGIVAALSASPAALGALEVDEAHLPRLIAEASPEAVVLLNLTRDQLDRVSEVRRLAASWRRALAETAAVVVANADDPLVVWAAEAAQRRRWVAAGQPWRGDAVGCPSCGGRLRYGNHGDWSCEDGCGLARPVPDALLETSAVQGSTGRSAQEGPAEIAQEGPAGIARKGPGGVGPEGSAANGAGARADVELVMRNGPAAGRYPLELALPGRFNRANAAMAAVAALALGAEPRPALAAMRAVSAVEGRYAQLELPGPPAQVARLLLAKNPAGWVELFGLLAPAPGAVVVAINARVADGRDPSWLWDVPFEQLAGRPVVATGERWRDLAVRLRYADVAAEAVADPLAAVRAAGAGAVDVVANYTAFQGLRRRLGAGQRSKRASGPPGRTSRVGPEARVGPAGSEAASAESGASRAEAVLADASRAEAVLADGSRAEGGPDGASTAGARRAGASRAEAEMAHSEPVRIVDVYPDLLGTYGDGGNAKILAARLRWRGIPALVVPAPSGEALPRGAAFYCLGGGEDGPQVAAAAALRAEGVLAAEVEAGAVVFAVCAGFQIVGTSFPTSDGGEVPGVGLLAVRTHRHAGRRAVGEVVAVREGLGRLTGFENHAGRTDLEPDVAPLATVEVGIGNGDASRSEGAVAGRVVGTYLHGPVLARNPELADWLLGLRLGALAPLQDAELSALHEERLAAAGRGGRLR